MYISSYPENCFNIVLTRRTFFISKLPHNVDTYMNKPQSVILYYEVVGV